MVSPDTDLRTIIGGRTVATLNKAFGMRTVADALHTYPRKYFRRGELTDLDALSMGDDVTVLAKVVSVHSGRTKASRGQKPKWRTQVVVSDGRGQLLLTFFNQKFIETKLPVGQLGLFAGTVGIFNGKRQLVHPQYELLPSDVDDQQVSDLMHQPIPIYPATAKVRTWTVRSAIELVLAHVDDLPDPLPAELRRRYHLCSFATAMRGIHQPSTMADVRRARDRLRWQEAFLLQLVLLSRRAIAQSRPAVPRRPGKANLLTAFDDRLPFALTSGQQAVVAEIAEDMAQSRPMLRLLQGDVGSGKTVVALHAMLNAVDSGAQTALVAPTEVLAGQHFATITTMLGPLAMGGQLGSADVSTEAVLLTGSATAKERRQALLKIASGEAGIVVGTHALLSADVQFVDLGLVVIDEQHRFGVDQRSALTAKGASDTVPHTLVMTATPIPRTAAMTIFGDLDVSTLNEQPGGRQQVSTHVIPVLERPAFVERVWGRIREEVAAGRQAFVVCPRITAAEPDNATPETEAQTGSAPNVHLEVVPTAAEELYEFLRTGPLAGLRVGLLHGRMSTLEKEHTMAAFAPGPDGTHRLDVLVATSVVEVGVDVPNATVMAIVAADRFGISSLHQLRGRIGRGEHAGVCLLLTDVSVDSPAAQRLLALASTTDGFELSRLDVQLRREGDVLGASQSGRSSSLRLLNVFDDAEVIESARAAAADVLASDPQLHGEPLLAAAVAALMAESEADYLNKA